VNGAACTLGSVTDVDNDAFTWTELYQETAQRLGNQEEARRMIEKVSGQKGAAWLIAVDQQAPISAADKIGELIKRRQAGEPLQYVVGSWGFRHLELKVDPRVLIPRPETEQVVEAALQLLHTAPEPLVADLGTGSGAIALSIASEHDGAMVYATDMSADALEVANLNLLRTPRSVQERVMLAHGDWFGALPENAKGRFDLIVSNPPYIGESEVGTVDAIVDEWEPHSALYSGPEGLDDIQKIIGQAAAWLKPRGSVIIELAPQQAEVVAAMTRNAGFSHVAIGHDLAGRQRFLVAATPGKPRGAAANQ
jgi:release factor glutamine methyltransferase